MRKFYFILLISFFSVSAVFSQIKNGIYQFDSERMLKSIDVQQMYAQYGIQATQDIVKNSSGNAVIVKDNSFVDYENGLLLKISSKGKVSSPENNTICGTYEKGKIYYYGYYEENNQTVHITCSGNLIKFEDDERASKSFNGTYKTTDSGTGRKQIITVKNGLYSWKYEDAQEGDFESWPIILHSDGKIVCSTEYTVRSIFENISNSIITSKTMSEGQLNPNGNISLKVITLNNGSGTITSSEPELYTAVKATNEINFTDDPEIAVQNGRKKTVISRQNQVYDVPQWYSENLQVDQTKIIACAYRKGILDDQSTQKLAEVIALTQISAFLGQEISTSSDSSSKSSAEKNEKYLYQVMDRIQSKKMDYQVINVHKDQKNSVVFVMIEVQK